MPFVVPVLLATLLVAALVVGHEVMWRRVRDKGLAVAICGAGGYAYIVALGLGLSLGRGVMTERGWYGVGAVLESFDARGKLEVGDRIVAIDGTPLHVPSTQTLVEAVNARRGAPVILAIVRDGWPMSVVVQPKLDRRRDGDVWVLGIRPRLDAEYDSDVGPAIVHALHYPIGQVEQGLGQLQERLNRDPDEPRGYYRVVDEYRASTERWYWLRLAMWWSTWAVVLLVLGDVGRALYTWRKTRHAPS